MASSYGFFGKERRWWRSVRRAHPKSLWTQEWPLRLNVRYELHVTLDERSADQPMPPAHIQYEVLAKAWARHWELFVQDICRPVVYREATAEQEKLTVRPWAQHPGATDDRDRPPRPSTAFAPFLFIEGRVAKDAFARVFLDECAWPRGSAAEGGQALAAMEIALLPFSATVGSLRTVGVVVLTFLGANLVMPLVAQALQRWSPIDMGVEVVTQTAIDGRLKELTWACRVEGVFHYDAKSLAAHFRQTSLAGTPASLCAVQGALAVLGYPPGRLDGVPGPDTDAAARAFARAWNLPENSVGRPVFNATLAMALTGKAPPRK
jgi:hypothetical protein